MCKLIKISFFFQHKVFRYDPGLMSIWRLNIELRVRHALPSTTEEDLCKERGLRLRMVPSMYTALVRPILILSSSTVWWQAPSKNINGTKLNKNLLYVFLTYSCASTLNSLQCC